MKKLLLILCISICSIILVIMMPFIAFTCKQINEPYTEIINSNWNMKLPNSYKEIYSKDSGASFHGDGERYHIFEYEDKDIINEALNWQEGKNAEVESAISGILIHLDVSRINRPNFDEEYMYYSKTEKDNSQIYLIFFPDAKRLYVIEYFM
ncbi:hypothetical protein [Clostridium sp.]|jgi:hypothetical protein|uniref:hypothetical protein n=1 Tax=Clostridium sp. TaxID=1506 RepID=UPI0039F588C0